MIFPGRKGRVRDFLPYQITLASDHLDQASLALFLVMNRMILTRPTKKMDLLLVLLTGFLGLVAVSFISSEH